jgi:hypothetical protein
MFAAGMKNGGNRNNKYIDKYAQMNCGINGTEISVWKYRCKGSERSEVSQFIVGYTLKKATPTQKAQTR